MYARSLYANAEAVSHFESALALGHPDVAELHVALGDLRTLSGEYTGAFASYEAAAARAGEADLPNVEHKLGMLCHRRGEWDLAESYFQSALSALPDEGADGERARLCADLSLTAHQSGRPADALDFARRALEVAETAEDVPARAQARNIMGILAKSRGDLDDAVEHSERSLALAETLADSTGARVAALNNLALACGAKGHLDRAIALDSKALELCVPLGDRHREAALLNNMSDLLYAAGRPDDAMAHLKQAVAIFAEIGEDAGSMQPEIWKLAEW